MKRLLSALILAVVTALNCISGAVAAQIGNFQYLAISASDSEVDLHGYFRVLQLWTDSGSADIYVELNDNVATVGGSTCLRIAGGGTYQTPVGSRVAISKFHVIGASASGHLNVAAYPY